MKGGGGGGEGEAERERESTLSFGIQSWKKGFDLGKGKRLLVPNI